MRSRFNQRFIWSHGSNFGFFGLRGGSSSLTKIPVRLARWNRWIGALITLIRSNSELCRGYRVKQCCSQIGGSPARQSGSGGTPSSGKLPGIG
jgi:hypothetical protein